MHISQIVFLGHQAHFAVFVNIKVTFSFTQFKVVKLSNQILYNFRNYILLKKNEKEIADIKYVFFIDS